MVKAGLKDSVIMKEIEANGAELDISPQALLELKKARVSQKLIEAMIAYSAKKKANTPGKGMAESAPAPSCKGEGVSRPILTSRVEPEYSEEARKAKYQGVVVLSVVIQKDGTVGDVSVAQPLGMGLDEKAIQAVKQWSFRPAMKDGNPLDCKDTVEITFRLL